MRRRYANTQLVRPDRLERNQRWRWSGMFRQLAHLLTQEDFDHAARQRASNADHKARCATATGRAFRDGADSVKTACGHYVILPWGCDYRRPTCTDPRCARVAAPRGR